MNAELLQALVDIALECESDIEQVDGQEILRLANAAITKAKASTNTGG